MAQRDYVGRGRSAPRKKSKSRKKGQAKGLPFTTLVIAAALVILFVGGLFYLVHNKKNPSDATGALPAAHQQSTNNGLPPIPEERWRYIKELENREAGIPEQYYNSTQPPVNQIDPGAKLTQEQRQLLEQMQSDMQQAPVQLQGVPANGEVPRSRVIITEPNQPLRMQTETARTVPPVAEKPKPQPVQEKPKAEAERWLIQCGSFRETEQAESVRASLAFSGLESRVSQGGGWYRVMLGPYDKSAAQSVKNRASDAGVTNCILRSAGG
ncbi:cell division protein FtsN [Morganella psychrotolerans]|uniref:Cell division protein FtsN n=1 Tax=Morganella psychrotolerans TaxID=368603 RepID=A0A1B8HQT2_9GAMM|nr:cell division protein FtsN [Morganella psychrotolerans]OBU11851.1 cell division protein FtsN [Morganella psychrotolerans]